MSSGRPPGVDHALELQTGDHIRRPPVLVLGELRCIEDIHAGTDHDGADLERHFPICIVKVDALSLACLYALLADPNPPLVQTEIHIDQVIRWYSLGKGQVDCRSCGETDIELIGSVLGTDL